MQLDVTPRAPTRRSPLGALAFAALAAIGAGACARQGSDARVDSLAAADTERATAAAPSEQALSDSARRADSGRAASGSGRADSAPTPGGARPAGSPTARTPERDFSTQAVPINPTPEPMPGSAATRAPMRRDTLGPPPESAPRIRVPSRANDARPSIPSGERPGPAPAAPAPSADGQDPLVSRLEREARALAGTGGCSGAAQCRVAPLGARACGGPRTYIPYCPLTTDSARLFGKLAELERAERAYNSRAGVASICSMVLAPVPGFEGGRCTAGAGGASGPQ